MYDATFKIVLFGDPNVGKKSLSSRFLRNLFVSDSKMTIGVDFEVKSLMVDRKKVKLQVWEFAGEERFRFLLPTYVRGARGGFFMYDITNYSSIAHIDDWLTIVKKEIKSEDIFPIIVLGNKADLKENREVAASEGIKIAKSSGVDGFIECSTKTGENIEEAFEALTRLMLAEPIPIEVEVGPVDIVEIGIDQLKESVQEYLNQKYKTNKQIIRATTIKAIKKSLKIADTDHSRDDEIWSLAIDISHFTSISKRITPKTNFFN